MASIGAKTSMAGSHMSSMGFYIECGQAQYMIDQIVIYLGPPPLWLMSPSSEIL
ncbi:hypothetical protein BS47DRAFT_457249 [Hydnum rufescens UP504]|uniref:Uncharacterized protein n=1 Tax=Hydnum rufescens UP504 TaxID=1448309 RepID=A0A9P6AJX4_9AGAM|nr:hypothetical protein BS47DRAFT_457249 [Hydnum rufescens UP504]